MNATAKKILGSMDYNTYYDIKYAGKDDLFDALISDVLFSSHFLLYEECFESLNAFYYTKDIKKIIDLYEEFIANYTKLNKTFELNNPIEIRTMFEYLLKSGLLSYNKMFISSYKDIVEIRGLGGISVIMGKGCCRHINGMLTNVLIASGFEAKSINVLIQRLVVKNIQEKYGNHVITFACDNKYIYFLDVSAKTTYHIKDYKKGILQNNNSNEEAVIKFEYNTEFGDRYGETMDYIDISERLSQHLPSINQEEEIYLTRNTIELLKINRDILWKFYLENVELYKDIASKMLKINKKIIHN